MRRVFSELNPEELCGLEVALKKVGKRAAALLEQKGLKRRMHTGKQQSPVDVVTERRIVSLARLGKFLDGETEPENQ